MRWMQTLKKTALKLESKQDSLFTYDIQKQKEYLAHFAEPMDDIERSFFQYKCQMKFKGKVMALALNSAFFFMTLVYLVKKTPSSEKMPEERKDAVFLSNDISRDILPLELLSEYPDISYENYDDVLNLNSEDKKFILKLIKRYPFSWVFTFKCLLKLSMYSARIHRNHPKAIITYAEYSFTSSVLTAYCAINDVEHINVMHGEKMFYMRDSFFHFHRCYIWDVYYKELFLQLRAAPEQFIVSIPKSLKLDLNRIVAKKYDFTYYLAAESKNELMTIHNTLKKLSEKGYSIAIRPHPRYTNIKIANDIFEDFEMEDFHLIDIESSILRTKHAVSLYSTVLNQAYHNGVEIIIDDITNPEKYHKLMELQYICLNKEHKLLSQEVK